VSQQQLHMLQRFFNVPATPSYDAAAGGVVLDRVCAAVGGAAWWVTATARLRAQAVWNMPLTREGKPHRALCDPGVYGGSARCRLALPRATVLRGAASLDSLHNWLPAPAPAPAAPPPAATAGAPSSRPASPPAAGSATGAQGGTGAAAPASAAASARAPVRGRLSLVSQGLLPSHDVSLEAAWHERAAAGGGAYADVARAAALSVASRRRGPLRYRLGVVTAQPGTPAAAAGGAPAPALGVLDGFGALHAQAACAIGGNVSFYPRAPAAAPDGLRRWPAKKRRPEYSAMPQRARATLGAWVGALGRAPLARAPAGTPAAPQPPQQQHAPLPPPLSRALAALRGDHYAFASLSAAVQLGSFSRPLLDYTALSLRCDVSHASGALAAEADAAARGAAAPPPLSGGAARGEGGGGVPPLGVHVTLGAAQQLVGPVRLRADVRMSGEAAAAAARAAWGGKSAAAACAGRDAALEAVYGVDVALPQVLGAARVVAWYSPQRGEGLVELRFLET
jgi:hypothetical protein